MSDGTLVVLAAVSTMFGVGALYRSWSRRAAGSRAMTAGGWLLLLIAAAAWVVLDGWEFGMVYAITVPPLAAGIILWLTADRRRGRVMEVARFPLGSPAWRSVRQHALTLLLVAPLGLAASTLLTGAIGLLLPLGELNRLVFIVCAMPVLWGLLAAWLTMDTRRARSALSLAAISGASLLTILLTRP